MPKKISLDLDTLAVESFDTTAPVIERRGTVRGMDGSETVCVTVGGYECISRYTECDCTEAIGCGGDTFQLTCHVSCLETCETC